MMEARTYDIAVVGTGPAGLAAALALARLGIEVAAIGAPPAARDTRTAALFAGSVTLLDNLGLGETCRTLGEPIHGIRIIDDMGALLRAPEVTFTAAEVGLDRFGYNVPNAALTEALRARAMATSGLQLIDACVSQISIGAERAEIILDDGRKLAARLVVGADGRQSLCREAAGIGARSWRYEQSALACSFEHRLPHGGMSTEFHRRSGPFTVVPSPGRSSSLVWVERPQEAERLAGLEDGALRAAIEERLQGLLGAVGEIGRRNVFPLTGLSAARAAGQRTALVGEAVHVIPPIGAQGLNLGLRDAACLADCVADALGIGTDVGGAAVTDAYAGMRRVDVNSRIWSIDLLNRSLLSGSAPMLALRGIGLHALKAAGPLRRLAIREGLAPSFVTPRLMQPQTSPP